jgi:hypothetical protein
VVLKLVIHHPRRLLTHIALLAGGQLGHQLWKFFSLERDGGDVAL